MIFGPSPLPYHSPPPLGPRSPRMETVTFLIGVRRVPTVIFVHPPAAISCFHGDYTFHFHPTFRAYVKVRVFTITAQIFQWLCASGPIVLWLIRLHSLPVSPESEVVSIRMAKHPTAVRSGRAFQIVFLFNRRGRSPRLSTSQARPERSRHRSLFPGCFSMEIYRPFLFVMKCCEFLRPVGSYCFLPSFLFPSLFPPVSASFPVFFAFRAFTQLSGACVSAEFCEY